MGDDVISRDELLGILQETAINIERVEEDLRAVKRRIEEHLDRLSPNLEGEK